MTPKGKGEQVALVPECQQLGSLAQAGSRLSSGPRHRTRESPVQGQGQGTVARSCVSHSPGSMAPQCDQEGHRAVCLQPRCALALTGCCPRAVG